jgi:hypothetical protein
MLYVPLVAGVVVVPLLPEELEEEELEVPPPHPLAVMTIADNTSAERVPIHRRRGTAMSKRPASVMPEPAAYQGEGPWFRFAGLCPPRIAPVVDETLAVSTNCVVTAPDEEVIVTGFTEKE